MESTNNQTPARSSEEQLKAKYGGKLYRVGITVPVDDESEKEFSYYFKRPTVPSYDRYIKTAAQGITKASKAFMLDAVIDEDAERLVGLEHVELGDVKADGVAGVADEGGDV